jgi:hypothetical protein
MKKVFLFAVAAALAGSASIASAQTTDKFSQLYNNPASVAPKFLKTQVAAELAQAVAAQQDIRRWLVDRVNTGEAQRVTKELIYQAQADSKSQGSIGGAFFFGIGGLTGDSSSESHSESQGYELTVKGGEYFIITVLGNNAVNFLDQSFAKAKQTDGWLRCVGELYGLLDAHRATQGEVPQLQARLKRFQDIMDELGPLMVAQAGVTADEKQAFEALKTWEQGSQIDIAQVDLHGFSLDTKGWSHKYAAADFDLGGGGNDVSCDDDTGGSEVLNKVTYLARTRQLLF